MEKQAAEAARALAKKKAEDEQRKRSEEIAARAALYPLPTWEELVVTAKEAAREGNPDPLQLYHMMKEMKDLASKQPPQWPPKDPLKV